MLIHPLLEKLSALRLKGMARALSEQMQQSDIESLCFEERFGLLVDIETTERENSRLNTRLRQANLGSGCMEDIDYSVARKLDKSLMLKLADSSWIKAHRNVIIVGPTGTGKSFIGCALAHKACLNGFSAYYSRLPRLLQELSVARGDGRYLKTMSKLSKIDVLILDDWGLVGLDDSQRRDLLELLEDRYDKKSTIVTSQLPIKLWHESIGDNTLADAILDRLVHNSYRIELSGESMRKKKGINKNEKK
jgi:DNA replication protein DnaC